MKELESHLINQQASLELAQLRRERMAFEAESLQRQADLEVTQAQLAVDQAREKIETQRASDVEELRKLELKIQQEQNELDSARHDMDQLSVKAPAPGLVVYQQNWATDAKVKVGDTPYPGMPLIELPDLSEMVAATAVHEVDIAKVAVGQPVRVTLDAFSEREFAGQVTSIATLAREKERRSSIKVFESIPLEAAFERGPESVCFVAQGGSFRQRPVKLGRRNDDFVVVEKGLAAGDRVALRDPTLPLEQAGRDGAGEGTVPEYQRLINDKVERGSFFAAGDGERGLRVCVLGAEAKRRLIPLGEALGQSVKIGDQWFQVIGVMERKGRIIESAGVSAFRDLDEDIYIPLGTSLDRLETEPAVMARSTRFGVGFEQSRLASELQQITLKVGRSEDLLETATVVGRILARRHHGNRDFRILIPEELLAQERKDKRIFDLVMMSIAGISLLVGGIGIMNIMLASVLERTREIGIRRALGATRGDILGQFLVEASLISLLGGLAGIGLGLAMAFAIDSVAIFRAAVSPLAIVAAFAVAAGVGLGFGIFPAGQAARLDPIEALRYE